MSAEHLPKVRVISTPVARIILLHGIGARLRAYYDPVLAEPVPQHLGELIEKLQ